MTQAAAARSEIRPVEAKILRGERLGFEDGMALYRHPDLTELAALADVARRRAVPETQVTYVVGRNVNYTNVCWVKCKFCAFYRLPGDPEGYVLPQEQIDAKIQELVDVGGSELLLQGGLNPDLRIDYYETLLRTIKDRFAVHLHALSPTEIRYIARHSDLTLEETMGRLRDAGLDSVPGAGAEILVDAVRDEIAPLKEKWADWMEVMTVAGRMGMTSSATMMYGSWETIEDRVLHLIRVREAQETGARFLAFIPWSFQGPGPDMDAPRATGFDYLRTVAVSRLLLDNIPHQQSSWVTQGPKVAQVSLPYGVDDMGSIMMEENVVSSAGCTWNLGIEDLRRLIEEAGYEPVQRDTYYRPWTSDTPLLPSPAHAVSSGI